MAYCVNCGVELDPAADVCPLCDTPAWRPEGASVGDPYFTTRRPVVGPAPRKALAWILSAMLLSVAICCALLNLLYIPHQPWSLYIIGAAMMLWVWLVPPLLLTRWPTFLKLTADVAAAGLYVYLISISLGGTWFAGLARPLLIYICALVFLLSFLLRGGRHSRLTTTSLSIGFVGLLLLGVEYFGDLYFAGVWDPGWSLITTAISIALIIPLQIVRHVPALREEFRRRFSL